MRATETPPPPLVPGSVHRVEIARQDERARGIASLGRRELRVANALAGEVVDVRLEHVGRHVVLGRIENVDRASADRVRDRCRRGEVCPGCGLRTTSPTARRDWKRRRVEEALAAAGVRDAGVSPTEAADSEDGWRHKAYLVARRTRKGILLGLFAEGTHRLVSIDGCPAHSPAVEAALSAVRRALFECDPPVFDERSRRGWLRAVSARASASDASVLVTLVTTEEEYDRAHRLALAIRREDEAVVGVVSNVLAAAASEPFGAEFHPLAGRPYLEERSGEFGLRVSAGSFFQVNPAVGQAIHDRIRSLARAAPAGPALDLYGGVGATSLRLAADGRPVTLVEVPGAAAADAVHNVGAAPAVRVVTGRVEDVLPTLVAPRPAVVVVNPPRSGLPGAVAALLSNARPSLLLYASCDPRTIGRDLGVFAASGGVVGDVIPFDLMPQTPHVEVLAAVRWGA